MVHCTHLLHGMIARFKSLLITSQFALSLIHFEIQQTVKCPSVLGFGSLQHTMNQHWQINQPQTPPFCFHHFQPNKKAPKKPKHRYIIIISTAGVLYQHHQVAQVAVANVRGGQKMPMAKHYGLGSRCYQSLDLYFYFYCAARPLLLGRFGVTEVGFVGSPVTPPPKRPKFPEKGVDFCGRVLGDWGPTEFEGGFWSEFDDG